MTYVMIKVASTEADELSEIVSCKMTLTTLCTLGWTDS